LIESGSRDLVSILGHLRWRISSYTELAKMAIERRNNTALLFLEFAIGIKNIY